MSVRNDILKDLKTTLEYIKVNNGFSENIKDVERKFLHWSNINTYPVLMVLGGNEEFDEEFGDQTQVDMELKIKGYSKDKSEPEVALCNLIADTWKCLENDTYNSHKAKMRPVRMLTDEGWLNLDTEGLAMFELQFIVHYRFSRSNP